MRQIRMFTQQPLAVDQVVDLESRARKHLVQVLRRRPGDAVTLFNGSGQFFDGVIQEGADTRCCQVRIANAYPAQTESNLRLALVQAIAKGDKMDWIIQKSVELGVDAIYPVTTERTEVSLDERRAERRRRRWVEIAIAASEQCGRAIVPEVHALQPLKALDPLPGDPALLLQPGQAQTLKQLDLQSDGGIRPVILIGPEGGFSESECAELTQRGCQSVTIGPRVLRTESSGPAMLAALQSLYGDWQ